MDFQQVQSQLNDLPSTFTRSGAPWTQYIDAISAALNRLTIGGDGVSAQLTFPNAQYGWIDVWGLMFGIQRNPNEANATYMGRISLVAVPEVGTPNGIAHYIEVAYGIAASVVESFAPGYAIQLSDNNITLAQITNILQNLSVIRPAGVPFQLYLGIGTYLDTVNYLDAPRIIGAYLNGALPPGISAGTPNSQPLLPTLFLTDPTLNT